MITESLLPKLATAAVLRVLENGAQKDGRKPGDWRENDSQYHWLSKASGHFSQWRLGWVSNPDPESGESHLAHAIADLMILLEHELTREAKDAGT